MKKHIQILHITQWSQKMGYQWLYLWYTGNRWGVIQMHKEYLRGSHNISYSHTYTRATHVSNYTKNIVNKIYMLCSHGKCFKNFPSHESYYNGILLEKIMLIQVSPSVMNPQGQFIQSQYFSIIIILHIVLHYINQVWVSLQI